MAIEATGTDLGRSSTGMQPNLAAVLSYVFGFVTGLIFFLVEKENQFIKFHAIQSMGFSVATAVFSFIVMVIPVVGGFMLVLLQIAMVVVWVICMTKAYHGEWYRLPVLGDFAAKQVGLTS